MNKTIVIGTRPMSTAGPDERERLLASNTSRAILSSPHRDRLLDHLIALAAGDGNLGVWEWDLKSDVVFVDAALLNHLGYDHGVSSIPGEIWREMFHEDDDLDFLKVRRSDRGQATEFDCSHRMRAREGSMRWLHTRASLVANPNGDGLRLLGATVDITERKLAGERLSLQNLILSTQQESSMDGILVVNREREWISSNQRFLDMWELSPEVAAKKDSRLALEEARRLVVDSDHFLARVEELYRNETEQSQDEIELLDGRVFDRHSAPIMAGDQYFGRVWYYRDLTAEKLAEKSLRQSEGRLRFLSRRLVEIQEQERRNLARELHDEVGQILTGIKLILSTVRRTPSENIRSILDQVEGEINDLMERVRELSLDLRPAILDDLGLLPALRWQFKRFSTQTGIEITFLHSGLSDRHQSEIEIAAFRVVQEGLTNVARHSGAESAAVHIHVVEQNLEIRVEDEGTGFDPDASPAELTASGILGMNERISLLGGELSLDSTPGRGTTLTALIPLSNLGYDAHD